MSISFHSKLVLRVFLLLSLLSFFFVVYKGSISSYDTQAYFKLRPYTSGGYPVFLRCLHFLFNENYLYIVVGVQFTSVIGSIFLFVFSFLKHFSLKTYQLILLLLLLFYPIVDENVFAINNISTEGLSYALFLQLVHVSYLVFSKRKESFYWLLALLAILLVTIRGQFKFMIPLFFLAQLLLFYKERQFRLKSFLLLLLIPLLVSVLDIGYHKVVHKQYFSTPMTWTHLVSPMLFVSHESDEQCLETVEQRQVFKMIHQKFREKKIGLEDHKFYKEPIDYNSYFFQYEYPTICNQTIQRELVRYYLEGKNKSGVQSYIEKERVCKELFFQLLPSNFSKWFILVYQNFVAGIGGVFMIVVYLVLLLLLFKFYIQSGNKTALFISLLILIILLNRFVISISVHNLTRYFFYTDWVSLLLLFLGVNLVVERNKSYNTKKV